jgi:hypothetical protein
LGGNFLKYWLGRAKEAIKEKRHIKCANVKEVPAIINWSPSRREFQKSIEHASELFHLSEEEVRVFTSRFLSNRK